MCRWKVEVEDVEVVHEVSAKHHLFFYQQAFAEAVGVVAAAIAHASAAGSVRPEKIPIFSKRAK